MYMRYNVYFLHFTCISCICNVTFATCLLILQKICLFFMSLMNDIDKF